jgi:hypothetical protein
MEIDHQAYDWLSELVAIFLAALIVAVFVFVGTSLFAIASLLCGLFFSGEP